MKSIYREDDARCNEVGSDVAFEAQNFFKTMLEKYPDYNPREMVELCSGEFHLMAARKILELRRAQKYAPIPSDKVKENP